MLERNYAYTYIKKDLSEIFIDNVSVDEIKDVIFDGDLFVESTLGNFVLEDFISVKCCGIENEL